MFKFATLLILLVSTAHAANTRSSFPTLEDASQNGTALSKSQSGDSASGKVGSTAFSFKDSSGNLVLPQLNASGYFQDFITNFPSTYAVTQSTSPWTISGNVNASQSGTWTVQQGSPPWSVSQSGTWSFNQGSPNSVGNAWPILVTDGTNTSTVKALNVQVAGTDYGLVTNSVIHGLTTAGGGGYVDVKVNPSGSLEVEANQGTSPWTISGNVNASQSGTWTVQQGTPPWSVSQSGTWNVGRTWSLSSGSDSVSAVQGTSPWVSNISQFGGSNVVTGTGASGSGIPRVTVANDSNVLATQSGTWTVQQGTPPWSVSQSGSWTTGRTWNLSSGSDSVTAQQGGAPWSVVGNAASGASDSGNPLKTGAVFNSTQPTVTTGQRVDMQATNRGGLIVATGVDNFNINNVSGTISLPTDAAKNSVQTNGTQKTQVVDASGNVMPTANATTTGSITGAGQSVTLNLPAGVSSTEIQLTGSFVGTVVFESTIDGSNYNARVFRSTGILNNLQTSTTTFPSEWRGNGAGMSAFRVRCTSYTSGTLTAALAGSSGPGAVFMNAAIPIGGISAANSPSQSLAGSATFTGTYEDMSQVASISVAVLLTQNGTLHTQFSIDGTTTNTDTTYALTANSIFYLTVPPTGQYFRMVVDNGSASAATLTADTYYRATAKDLTRITLGNITNLNDNILAPVNRAVLTGRTGTNAYVDVKADNGGNLATTNNLTQVNSNAVNTGTGAASTGTQRVAVANDSQIKLWDGTTNGTFKAASTLPALTDTAQVITQRPDNTGTVTQTSVSCASTSTTLLAAGTATMFISIRNPTTSTQTIWLNIAGATATAAAPNIDLPPGAEAFFSADGPSWLPSQQLNCISGGTASSVSLIYK